MAGTVLPSRELAQMNDGNFMALKTAKGQLKEAQALIADLKKQIAEYDAEYRAVIMEECAPDEKHCTCVPVLRKELAELRAARASLTCENGGLKRQTVDMLLSKDDELALMAARCTALADQLEQAQKVLAATSRALNEKLAELDAARDWARAWKMAASKWFGMLAPEQEAKQ